MDKILSSFIVRPVKARQCQWCWESIPAKEPCTYVTQIYEGDFQSFYIHPECNAALQELSRENQFFEYRAGDYYRGSKKSIDEYPEGIS